jgi:hypothetical protein
MDWVLTCRSSPDFFIINFGRGTYKFWNEILAMQKVKAIYLDSSIKSMKGEVASR